MQVLRIIKKVQTAIFYCVACFYSSFCIAYEVNLLEHAPHSVLESKLTFTAQELNLNLVPVLDSTVTTPTTTAASQSADSSQPTHAPTDNSKKESPSGSHIFQILIMGIAAALIALLAYRNRRLNQEIKLRNEIEKKLFELNETNERFRILFYESSVGHALNDLETGQFISINQSFADIIGYTLDEINRMDYWKLTPERYAQEEQEQLDSLRLNRSYGPYEKHYIHKNGNHIAVRLNGSLVTDMSGRQMILSMVEDISADEQAKENLKLSSLVLNNSSEGMIITNEENKIILVNPAFTTITGYDFSDVEGKSPHIFSSEKHDKAFFKTLWNTLTAQGQWQGEIWNTHKSGQECIAMVTIDTIKDEKGRIVKYVILFSDVTQRKRYEQTIWEQANFDALTGLSNRNHLHNQMEKYFNQKDQSNLRVALLLIDLDKFKEVNDTLGHDIGDLLLQTASKRILHCVRKTDTVARLGGDEFIIALYDIDSNEHISEIAEKLINSLHKPFHLNDETVYVSASIGITICPDDSAHLETLMKNADQAMYAAKAGGRNCFSYFTQSLQDEAQKRLRLSNDLRLAVNDMEFEVCFQPIIDLKTGQLHKAEALIRWHHPNRGFVSPAEFIPIAEDIGLISEIGNWVCTQASMWQHHWLKQFGVFMKISVNMSPVQFRANDKVFSEGFLDSLCIDGHASKGIIIEITEGLLLNAEPDVLEKLYYLRDQGIEVAIDDFGTGYSSLSYLKKFNIDYLKIDRSFIMNIENDPNDLALTYAIIVMAHKLGIRVIAEGVENAEQAKILKDADCDFAQGYFYSKPLRAADFEKKYAPILLNDKTHYG